MKILHLVSRSQRRGAEMVAIELANELDQLGHENRLLALGLRQDGGRDSELTALVDSSEIGGRSVAPHVRRLRAELAREPVDLIVGHGGRPTEVAVLAAGRSGPPIVWQRILGIPDSAWRSPVRRAWWRTVAGRINAAVALSPALSAEMRRLGFAGPVWEIPNARRPDRFATVDREAEGAELRAQLGVTPDEVIACFVGHLVEQKRPERAVEVLARVRRSGRPMHLVMAGDGPLRPALEAQIDRLGLGDHVTLLGHYAQVEKVYGGSDLMLLTSAVEGVPGVAIESLMSGCPVVSYPLESIDSVVEHDISGIVMRRADVGEMAHEVAALIDDDKRRRRYQREARRSIEHFSLVKVATRYAELFETVVEATSAPGLRVFWYWPFARAEHAGLATAMGSLTERLVVETLDQPGTIESTPDEDFVVCNDLPVPTDVREGTLSWVAQRAKTYTDRVVGRRRLLRREDFDVCHVMFLNRFTDPLDLWRLRRHENLVVTVHDAYPHEPRLPKQLERRLMKWQVRAPALIVVHSERVRDLLVDDYEVEPDKIVEVPHYVTRYDEGRPERMIAPPTDGVTRVLFFGTLRRNKGVEVLLDAIARVDDEDVRFVIAGRGFRDVEELVERAAAADARIEATIGWIPPDEKHRLHVESTLVVLPYTEFDSQSGVLHDAYAYERPVVVSDVGSLGNEVRGRATGWVVPPGDPVALSDAIVDAISDAEVLAQHSRAAAIVAAERSPEVAAAALYDAYVRMLDRR